MVDTPLMQKTELGANYTVVVSTFTGSQTGNGAIYAYILHVITGSHLPDNQTAYYHEIISSDSDISVSHHLSVPLFTIFMLLLLLLGNPCIIK